MWNRKKLAVLVAGALSTGTVAVMACGPFFPLQVLDDRAGTLAETPINSFAFEVTHLVKPADALKAVERPYDEYDHAPQNPDQPDKATLPDAQWQALQAMRKAPDDEHAYAWGATLPAALRLYTTGAVDLNQAKACASAAQPCSHSVDELQTLAAQRFQAVLDLPAEQAAPRAIWAAFALGRLHAARGEHAGAAAAFAKVRTLALAGTPDPWSMAVGSYGEEARLYLVTPQRYCDYTDFANATACVNGIEPANLKRAIALYAEQAARGSDSALQSLRLIAGWLMLDSNRATSMIDDPLSQKLLVGYSLAEMGETVSSMATANTVASYPSRGPNPVLQTLVAAIRQRGLEQVSGADKLAVLAYRIGDYGSAQTLADKQPSAMSGWVHAKLALRRGDAAAAAQAYAQALKGFPTLDNSIDAAGANQIKGEQAVLSLSRGEYVQALEQFYSADKDGNAYAADYSGDMDYVAERVLTLSELKAYVDTHVPASPAPQRPADFANFNSEQLATWGAQPGNAFTKADGLRLLLARRIVRDGQIEQALQYFPQDSDPRNNQNGFDLQTEKSFVVVNTARAFAAAYGQALHDGAHDWLAVNRARAWYTAATLARQHGMEIMGYQQAPDFAVYGGSFTYGAGRGSPLATLEDGDAAASKPLKTPQQRAAADLPGPLVTEDERQRYAATEAQPLRTFHYRYLAADHAEKAADNLPPRSQAFAAVLCQGTSFVQNDEARASKLYVRYAKEGAAVDFAEDFGRHCVEPDFDAAARFPYVHAWRDTRYWLHQHRAAVLGLAGLLVVGFIGLIAWRVRRKAA